MGCGSGILAIGAKKLGFRSVAGFDNDPDAVEIARENAVINGVEIPFETADLASSDAVAEVVVANILAPVLIQFAEPIARAVNAGGPGALVISGILDEQYPAVLAAFVARGFREVENVLISGWRSGRLVR